MVFFYRNHRCRDMFCAEFLLCRHIFLRFRQSRLPDNRRRGFQMRQSLCPMLYAWNLPACSAGYVICESACELCWFSGIFCNVLGQGMTIDWRDFPFDLVQKWWWAKISCCSPSIVFLKKTGPFNSWKLSSRPIYVCGLSPVASRLFSPIGKLR